MKYSKTKNTVQYNRQIIFIEVGDVLYFDSDNQFVVTSIKGSRPFHNEIDLFQRYLDTGIHPVVLTKNEL